MNRRTVSKILGIGSTIPFLAGFNPFKKETVVIPLDMRDKIITVNLFKQEFKLEKVGKFLFNENSKIIFKADKLLTQEEIYKYKDGKFFFLNQEFIPSNYRNYYLSTIVFWNEKEYRSITNHYPYNISLYVLDFLNKQDRPRQNSKEDILKFRQNLNNNIDTYNKEQQNFIKTLFYSDPKISLKEDIEKVPDELIESFNMFIPQYIINYYYNGIG